MPIWLIGAGTMALAYSEVLEELSVPYKAIGRGEKSAQSFFSKTGIKPSTGGVDAYLKNKPAVPDFVIVSVGVEKLSEVTILLLEYGIKNILVEKPAAITKKDLIKLQKTALENKASVWVGYNRRYYSSVFEVRKIIENDGGVASFNFEFTEWSHIIKDLKKGKSVLEKWFLGNSTHVVDLAFHLGGIPEELYSITSGSLGWHPSAAIFAGAGRSSTGALFSYRANWCAPGRWGVEILTTGNSKLILCPMEQLQIQKTGSVHVEKYPLNDKQDLDFKPGILLQIKAFLTGEHSTYLCSLDDQVKLINFYNKIANYSNCESC